MPSPEALQDEFVKHQIGLQRLTQATNIKIARHLTAVQDDLSSQISKELARINGRGNLSRGELERLQGLQRTIAAALQEAHVSIRADLSEDLLSTARYEADWLQRFYAQGVGIGVVLDAPSASLLKAVVLSRPFQGAVLRDWARSMERNQLARIGQQIAMGITEGEGIDQIVARLKGSRALQYRDGQFAKDRRSAEALVRTAVNHTVTRAHEALIDPHKSDFPDYVWVSVLDGRTTKICQARSGETYKTGEGPLPPAHWNCRSTVRYRSRWEAKVEDEPTYDRWLARQDAATQDDILGRRAGVLYRKGGLSVKQFVDRQGTALTLDELRKKETAAWEKAFGTK